MMDVTPPAAPWPTMLIVSVLALIALSAHSLWTKINKRLDDYIAQQQETAKARESDLAYWKSRVEKIELERRYEAQQKSA
jgi:FtsZ-interacting cell division protein ZipA